MLIAGRAVPGKETLKTTSTIYQAKQQLLGGEETPFGVGENGSADGGKRNCA